MGSWVKEVFTLLSGCCVPVLPRERVAEKLGMKDVLGSRRVREC